MADKKNSINISGSGNTIGAMSQGDKSSARGDVHQQFNAPREALKTIEDLYATLEARVKAIEDKFERQQAQVAVDGLKDELSKGDKAQEETLAKRLASIKATIGDIFEVVVATIANPQAGFAVIARKVAEKAMKEA